LAIRDFAPDLFIGSAKLTLPRGPWLYWCVAVLAGVLDVWLLVGWREINPLNLSWLVGDSAQYEVGWEFLRYEHVWRFPPTMLSRLDFPSGVSASNLDITPLIGLLLRPLSPFLPHDFQYLGLYAVFCYVLQTWYGLRLVSIFSHDRIVTVLGGLFFMLSPILTIRLYEGHFPHSSHWILLACIYYYFRPAPQSDGLPRYLTPFLVLCVIAAAISPYFALMAIMLAFAALLRCHLEDSQRVSQNTNTVAATEPTRLRASSLSRLLQSYAFWAVVIPAATMASLVVFGFVTIGSFAGGGYTIYSMNMLAPIDPLGGALVLRHIPLIGSGQAHEGYNYLGVGVLLLLLVALARKPELLRRLGSPTLRPLVVVSVVFALLALSVKITFGDRVLFTVPVPTLVYYLLAAFRASGRLFWPVHYLIVLGAITGVVLSIRSVTWQRWVLAAALLLQYGDLLALRNDVAIASEQPHPNPLVSVDWGLVPQHHRHLVILPALQCDLNATPGGLEAWPFFARLAARSNLTLNSAYLGRIGIKAFTTDCTSLPETVLHDGLQPDTAYVLGDAFALQILRKPVHSHFCRRVDGFNLCTYDPVRARESSKLAEIIHVHASASRPRHLMKLQFSAE